MPVGWALLSEILVVDAPALLLVVDDPALLLIVDDPALLSVFALEVKLLSAVEEKPDTAEEATEEVFVVFSAATFFPVFFFDLGSMAMTWVRLVPMRDPNDGTKKSVQFVGEVKT